MDHFKSLVLLFLSVVCVVSSSGESWKFLVYGDSRGTSHDDQVADEILGELVAATTNESPDFVLFPGDLVYWGKLTAFQEWKSVMQPVYDAGIGIYPVMGNHDAFSPTSYKAVFEKSIPDNGPDGEIDLTYAIAHSNALILALDAHAQNHRVNQAWVEEQLDSNILPHVFAFSHEPAFKAQHNDCLDDFPVERDLFWECLEAAGAHAYFAGHDHFYSHARIENGDGDQATDVHQYITGAAGAPLYGAAVFNGENGVRIPVDIFFELQYGYVVVEIDGLDVTITWKHRTAPGVFEPTADVLHKRAKPGRTLLNILPDDSNIVLDISCITPASTNTVQGCSYLTSNDWTTIGKFVTTSNAYAMPLSSESSNSYFRVLSE
ncbi:metallophosphoesterase [Pontiellaceae bacterium B12227]|nr:metallophosphoesterase [Pontiellaceae bacterium B12227]